MYYYTNGQKVNLTENFSFDSNEPFSLPKPKVPQWVIYALTAVFVIILLVILYNIYKNRNHIKFQYKY